MNCRECKFYKTYCELGNIVFRDGTIDAVNYDLFGKKFINGKYIDCEEFTSIDELTLFDFEGE